MRDARLQRLAQNLVQYSIDVQPNENILIEMIGNETEFVKCLVEEVAKRGYRIEVSYLLVNKILLYIPH